MLPPASRDVRGKPQPCIIVAPCRLEGVAREFPRRALHLTLARQLAGLTSEALFWMGRRRLDLFGIVTLAGSTTWLAFTTPAWLLLALMPLSRRCWHGRHRKDPSVAVSARWAPHQSGVQWHNPRRGQCEAARLARSGWPVSTSCFGPTEVMPLALMFCVELRCASRRAYRQQSFQSNERLFCLAPRMGAQTP